jgi:hypothetical protein
LGAKGGGQKEQAKEAEEHGAMAHEDGKVGVVEGQAIEGCKPFTAKHSRKRQQVNDGHDNKHC